MVLWNGNSNGNAQGDPQSAGGSPEIVPFDTTIKSKIPRPVPPDVLAPPDLNIANMPGAGLPKLNMPASKPPTLLTAPDSNDSKYKMGVGGRIMGTVANFLSGMANRGPVVNTGRGAVNRQYYRDEGNYLRQLNGPQAPNQLRQGQQPGFRGQKGAAEPQDTSSTNGSSSENKEYNYGA